MRLVLASASPARARLLRAAGVEPEVVVSDVDEPALVAALPPQVRDDPTAHCLTLARAKAEDVAARLGWVHPTGLRSVARPEARDRHPGARDGDEIVVVGCDSVLDLDGEPLGKPADPADAVARWLSMRGRDGVLRTGHAVIRVHEGSVAAAVAATVVRFGRPDDAEVLAYVETGEPLAVAGAFTLDGLGSAFVRGVDGDPANVIGLSIPLLRDLLRDLGLRWIDLWR